MTWKLSLFFVDDIIFFLNYFVVFVGASMKVILHICKYSKQHGANAPWSVKVCKLELLLPEKQQEKVH